MAKQSLFTPKELGRTTGSLAGDARCVTCGLYRTCRSPKMGVTGQGERGVLILAEAPGKSEDEQGEQLIGHAGQLLRRTLNYLGWDLDRDCWKLNAVNCRPPSNRTPDTEEVDCCRPKVYATINQLKPERIILLGRTALESLLAPRWNGGLGEMALWRGRGWPDLQFRTWVFPTFHPSYILREQKRPVIEVMWANDLDRALNGGLREVDWEDSPEKHIKVVLDREETTAVLRDLQTTEELVALDYETTGLKPYNPGHHIYSVSVATQRRGSFSFPMFDGIKRPLIRFLSGPAPKTAHHLKFEELWSTVILGTPVKNWRWCSLEAAHVLDNRKVGGRGNSEQDEAAGGKDLKFLSFCHFGVEDWSGEISEYLRSDGKQGANSFNKIDKAPLLPLLRYGGMDTWMQLRLAQYQMEKLK